MPTIDAIGSSFIFWTDDVANRKNYNPYNESYCNFKGGYYETDLDHYSNDDKLCIGICVCWRFTGIRVGCRKRLHAYRRGGYRLSLMGQTKEVTLNYYK